MKHSLHRDLIAEARRENRETKSRRVGNQDRLGESHSDVGAPGREAVQARRSDSRDLPIYPAHELACQGEIVFPEVKSPVRERIRLGIPGGDVGEADGGSRLAFCAKSRPIPPE